MIIIYFFSRNVAVPGTWEYLEHLEQEHREEAKIGKRFKMMRRKKELCDCFSCREKAQNVRDFKESIDETLILLLNRSEDDTISKPKRTGLFGRTKMVRSASLRNGIRRGSTLISSSLPKSIQRRPRSVSSPEVNVSGETRQRLWCKSVKDRIKESGDASSKNSFESPSTPKTSRTKTLEKKMSVSEQVAGLHGLKSKLESLVV